MKYLKFYNDVLNCKNQDDVFNYLINHLKPSNITWSYFVNWDKVFNNTKNIEIALNSLNYLIGKDNFDEEFRFLVKQRPEIVKVIPNLIVRNGNNDNKFKILVDYKQKKLVYQDYDFSKNKITDNDIIKYLEFIKKTGLKNLLVSQKIKNLVDYMIGVEAGLDSNGRKNRSGHSMEKIIKVFIDDVCDKMGFDYVQEANAKKIKQQWGIDVPVDKSSRRYDFVIKTSKELVIIETNFYGGGGSKLKSTAGEYQNLFNVLNQQYKFIWITDGLGWKNTTKPLREAFNNNDYLINLKMIEEGILNYLLN